MKKSPKVRPRFYWNLPRNWRYLLGQDVDRKFYHTHKVLYALITVLAIIFLFGIPLAYALILIHINKNVFGPLGGLGILGAMLIGVSFCNILCAFLHQYFGHYVTLILFFGGLAISAATLWIALLLI